MTKRKYAEYAQQPTEDSSRSADALPLAVQQQTGKQGTDQLHELLNGCCAALPAHVEVMLVAARLPRVTPVDESVRSIVAELLASARKTLDGLVAGSAVKMEAAMRGWGSEQQEPNTVMLHADPTSHMGMCRLHSSRILGATPQPLSGANMQLPEDSTEE